MNVYLPFTARLPSAYQEVEYIQSSGTQYIKIGTSFKTSYKTVIDFQMTVIGGDYIPVGIKYNTTRYGIDAWQSNFNVITGGSDWSNTISEDTNRHTITIDKGTAIVDGNNYSVSYTNYTFSQGIGVFCYNEYDESPQYTYKSSNKLYKLDIYDENGTHIYDLVPCYRKSDSVIGLYDLVNNQFYTNSGTGTFSKGNDVTMAFLKNAYIGEVWTPGSNTFGYYTFDDKNASQITDFSGNNRNLTGGTMPSYTLVSGTNYAGNYANVSGSVAPTISYSSLSTNFTILLWINPTTNSACYCSYIRDTSGAVTQLSIIYGYNSEQFEYFSENGYRTTIKSSASINNWYLVGFTRNGSTIQTYADGIAGNSISMPTVVYGNFYLGSSTSGDRLKGQIGECVVENKARTAQEVSHYYDITKSKYGL